MEQPSEPLRPTPSPRPSSPAQRLIPVADEAGLPLGPQPTTVADQKPAGGSQANQKPRLWGVGLAMFAILPVQVMAGLTVAAGFLLARDASEPMPDPSEFLNLSVMAGLLAISSLLLAGLAVGAALLSDESWQPRLRLRSPIGMPIWVWVVSGVGALAVTSFGATVGTELLHMMGIEPQPLVSPDPSRSWLVQAWFLVALAVFPAIGEELLFRGYVQRRLEQRFHPAWAIGLGAAAFAVIHLNVPQACGTFLLGLWLGYLTHRTGSVYPAIFCHFVNNAVAGAILLRVEQDSSQLAWQQPWVWLPFFVGFVCLVVAARAVHLGTQPRQASPRFDA